MGLIDTHTHLESFARHRTLPEILARAQTAGLEAMITIGTSPEDWGLYRRLAAENPGFVHYTVGLHPCAVDGDWETAMAKEESFWSPTDGGTGPLPVALGEIGLDRFHLPKEPDAAAELFAQQRAAFAAGLAIAKRLDTRVVVHSRGAFQECVEMIDASGVDWRKVVFHCFTESEPEMAELIRRGGRGSFTGVVTYKSAGNVRAAAKAQGLERMMVETDAPYLTPMPHRGKPNEPAYVRLTAEYCAREVFGVADEEFARITSANAREFFGL
ncbi:TatD family hydrolase [Opitutus terrae]|uniref:TatD-related deoxyribonuclease n=1 Tax=Opitutus terrae (strain DSM 11246 / JCM 15787 / PB90-1) TaxID=452637 RepID=B1ZXZ5_OPITP|nr:TatD family hydrolase [Opitutus terrae]ACB75194.1 TatD-related deoxyribonuclease [Opitutus terrae PB90-1]